MTRIFDVNENNDIFAIDGRLQVATGLRAVLVNCERAVKVYLGEMIYAADRGIDYFGDVFSGAPNILKFEVSCRNQIKRVQGVVSIDAFFAEVRSAEDGSGLTGSSFFYTATIRTEYGIGTIQNSIPLP